MLQKTIVMNNRVKTFALFSLIFILTVSALYVAASALIQSEFSKIEDRDTSLDTARAVDALSNRVDQLAVKSSDWSNWDDTYNYIVTHDQAYVDSNLVNGSLNNLGINFMLFYNSAHQLVKDKGIDADGNDLTVPPQLLAYFDTKSTLFCDSVAAIHKGFVNLPNGPLFFAARPILTSNATGPSRGTLVFAEYLSPSEISALADVTHLNLNFYRLDDLPKDASSVIPVTTTTAKIKVLGSDSIAGYQGVNDVFGHELMVVRVEVTRDAFIQASTSLRYFLVIIGFVTLGAIVLTLYITRQLINSDRTIQLKDEFFSVASHELRTPLTAIRSNSTLLQTQYGSKNDKDFTELTADIHEASTRLIRLVTNFLDAARLENGRIPINLTSVDLQTVSASVVNEMQGLAKDKKISIRSDIPDDLPKARADEDRVKQVIYNLVGNAAKFTETGGITINAEQAGTIIRVLITDTGRGMSPEAQRLLFHKFQQTRTGDDKTGSGLGLYISKMLVELMGGQIDVQSSQVDKGTTIAFTLPVADQQNTPS